MQPSLCSFYYLKFELHALTTLCIRFTLSGPVYCCVKCTPFCVCDFSPVCVDTVCAYLTTSQCPVEIRRRTASSPFKWSRKNGPPAKVREVNAHVHCCIRGVILCLQLESETSPLLHEYSRSITQWRNQTPLTVTLVQEAAAAERGNRHTRNIRPEMAAASSLLSALVMPEYR